MPRAPSPAARRPCRRPRVPSERGSSRGSTPARAQCWEWDRSGSLLGPLLPGGLGTESLRDGTPSVPSPATPDLCCVRSCGNHLPVLPAAPAVPSRVGPLVPGQWAPLGSPSGPAAACGLGALEQLHTHARLVLKTTLSGVSPIISTLQMKKLRLGEVARGLTVGKGRPSQEPLF